MGIYKILDGFINVLIPLILGSLVYVLPESFLAFPFFKNYFADGMWAYAFISAILLIWHRNINYFWIIVSFIVAIGFEVLQHLKIVRGIGDFFDVMIYFIFFIIAFLTNNFFKRRFHYATNL